MLYSDPDNAKQALSQAAYQPPASASYLQASGLSFYSKELPPLNSGTTKLIRYHPAAAWAKETNRDLDGKISMDAAEKAKLFTAEQVNGLQMGKGKSKEPLRFDRAKKGDDKGNETVARA